MELVIKIPDELYNDIKTHPLFSSDIPAIERAIKNGTPLPKGHKIIDEYALQEGLALIPVEDRTFRKAVEFIEHFPEVFDADKEENA